VCVVCVVCVCVACVRVACVSACVTKESACVTINDCRAQQPELTCNAQVLTGASQCHAFAIYKFVVH